MCVESTRDDSRAHLGCTVATHGVHSRPERYYFTHGQSGIRSNLDCACKNPRTPETRDTHEHSRITVSFQTRDTAVGETASRWRRRSRGDTREETADALTPSAQRPRRETSRSRPIGNTLEKRDTKREEHLSLKYGVWSSNMTVTTSRAWRYGSQQQPNTSGSAHREEEIGRAASWRRSSTAALRLQRLQRVR